MLWRPSSYTYVRFTCFLYLHKTNKLYHVPVLFPPLLSFEVLNLNFGYKYKYRYTYAMMRVMNKLSTHLQNKRKMYICCLQFYLFALISAFPHFAFSIKNFSTSLSLTSPLVAVNYNWYETSCSLEAEFLIFHLIIYVFLVA